MKFAELMTTVLALPLEHKETIQVVLGHSIKSELQNEALVHEEMQAAVSVADTMTELTDRRRGRQPDENSVFGLVSSSLESNKEVRQDSLIKLIVEKKGWTRQKAINNLTATKPRFANQLGVSIKGRGKDAVWSVETSSN